MHQIRYAQADEVETLVAIERRSSQRFAQVEGLTGWVDDITPTELVHVAISDRLAWVAELIDSGELVGWCFASIIDDSLFVEQVDVLPELGRRGIGQSLLTAVAQEAERGFDISRRVAMRRDIRT